MFSPFSSISGYLQYLILGWPTMLLSPVGLHVCYCCHFFPQIRDQPEDKKTSIIDSVVENTNAICDECKLGVEHISNAILGCYSNPNFFTFRAVITIARCELVVDKIQEWSTKEDTEIADLPLAQTGCPVHINTYDAADCDPDTDDSGGGSRGSNNSGSIAGGVIAAIVVVLVVIILAVVTFLLYWRRRTRKVGFYRHSGNVLRRYRIAGNFRGAIKCLTL